MNETLREEIALFRYGVISQMVLCPLAPGEKERLLTAAVSQTWKIPGSRRTRLGRTTVRDWLALYLAMGFEGLKPQPRCDTGRSRALPEPVQDILLALRAERPRASVESLVRAARLSGKVDASLTLAPNTVRRFLAAHGKPVEPQSLTPDAKAFTYAHSGDLWTADIMHGPRLLVPGRRDGAKTYLYAMIDDATRMVPYAAFYQAENAACFLDAFKQGLLRRGLPRRLYCDNGATFRTHHLQVVCATLNVALIHSRPHQPRGRGKIERFFRSVRSAFLPHVNADMLADLAPLNRVFWAWLEGEYHQTPHGGLDGDTPLDRFLLDQDFIRPAPEDLDRLLRMTVTRRIGRDRTVRLDSRVYEAPDGYAGEKVEVLYDPYDPRQPVHFRLPGERQEIPLTRLDLETNATLKRAPRQTPPDEPPPQPTGISYLDLIAESFYGKESNT